MHTMVMLLLLGQIETVEVRSHEPRRLPADVIGIQYEVPPTTGRPALAQVPPPPPAEESAATGGNAAPPPQLAPVAEPAATAPSMVYEMDTPLAGCCSDGGCEPWLASCPNCPHGLGGSGCPTCMLQEDDVCICKLNSTYDLYPHYAYYPRYHGYYYFRPYNYQTIAEHQQFAACIGLDPRMPYSLSGFDRIYAGFPQKYPRDRSPLTSTMQTGSGLSQLEDLLAPAPQP